LVDDSDVAGASMPVLLLFFPKIRETQLVWLLCADQNCVWGLGEMTLMRPTQLWHSNLNQA
jgi:hypothetical protein